MKNVLIVSFTSLLQDFGFKTTEFKKTLESIGFTNNLYAVDTTKKWYNDRNMSLKIEQEIRKRITATSPDHVVFLGNSMGGFGAILYSSIIRECNHVISITPQIHIDPKLVKNWDDRFLDYFKEGEHLNVPSVVDKFTKGVKYDIVIGEDEIDKKHFDLIEKDINIELHIIEGALHNVPRVLKHKGILGAWLLEMITKGRNNE